MNYADPRRPPFSREPGESQWRGLTWDHPRGYRPLDAVGGPVRWDRQPLEGFESYPISEHASRYDLLIIDHPGVASAVQAKCLRPMDDVLSPADLTLIRASAVGASFDSYRYAERQWALPIDAAAQVMAVRPDLLADPFPETWQDVLALAPRVRLALPLAGPHALLTFLAICVALGEEPACASGALVSRGVGAEALTILSTVVAAADPRAGSWNPIALLEHMTTSDTIAICPLVYGYVTYTRPSIDRPVVFSDAPRGRTGGRPGSVLGGTGIAVSRRVQEDTANLASYLRMLVSDTTQRDVIVANGGQPANRSAWLDSAAASPVAAYFSGTVASVETAWVRPRYPGYVAFQDSASAVLRAVLTTGGDHDLALATIDDLYRTSRRRDEEPPDE
jgi:multiple sugar transport system substrate-binding protein